MKCHILFKLYDSKVTEVFLNQIGNKKLETPFPAILIGKKPRRLRHASRKLHCPASPQLCLQMYTPNELSDRQDLSLVQEENSDDPTKESKLGKKK